MFEAPTRGKASAPKRGRGRPPGRKSTGTSKTAPKRGVAKATAQTKQAQKRNTTKKAKKRRSESSQEEAEDELSGIVADEVQPSKRRKRKSHVEPDEIAEEEPKSRKKYVQLETKTRRIPQEQIDTWPQVSQQLLEQIVGVIRDAKEDIANTQRDERRVIAAHNTLNPLVRRLSRHLAASRIPPQAKDIHFNIDKLTERNAQISRSVTTARHSKLLLSEQLKIIERMFGKEEESLEQLKREVTKWRAEWKHQEKHGRLHPLLQNDSEPANNGDVPDDIGLKSSAPPYSTVFDAPDADLAPVLEQLRRSLESMQSNHAQVENIDEAMTDAQAALDDVLFRHTSAQQYAAL